MKDRCPQAHLHWFAITREQFDDVEAQFFLQGPGAMLIGSAGDGRPSSGPVPPGSS